ncbi:MAG: hypothetical protein ACI8QH_000555, partial [Flammeovirgaceae bacterium]
HDDWFSYHKAKYFYLILPVELTLNIPDILNGEIRSFVEKCSEPKS